MTRKIYILSVILAIIILAIIPLPQPTQEQTSEGENVLVDKTKNFSIMLESNPTTGYNWEAKFDEDYIKLVDSNFTPYPETSEMVGGGGVQNFEFSALKSGETQIIFTYTRPWEKDNPAETKTYNVKII